MTDAARGSEDLLACVEVGGTSVQTVLFSREGPPRILDGPHRPREATLAIAVPGVVADGRVRVASNLDWTDVDPVTALDLDGPAAVLCNDAEAAALGEAVLRDPHEPPDLVYVGLGTGVGGAVVRDGRVVAGNLFGHASGFGDAPCPCGRRGCLETVIGGWALPDALTPDDRDAVVASLVQAVDDEPVATPPLLILAGGVTSRYPDLTGRLQRVLPERTVESSRAPAAAKSAAAWGLHRLVAVDASTDGGRSAGAKEEPRPDTASS